MLAIIIPYFKLTFFEATLQSLADQTDKRFKVYIGDDASPEDCSALLKQFQEKFDFIYHRFTTNLGVTALTKQWERCIALSADEEWLMILGDDDVLSENVVEEFYKNLGEIINVGCNVIRFATQVIDAIKSTHSAVQKHLKTEENAASFYFKRFKGQVRCSLSEHIFKRKVYLKHGFESYPLAWHSDDYAWLNFAENRPIYCINDAFLKISISSESISGNNKNLNSKNLAASLFYLDLIQNKLYLFSKEQRLDLLYYTEVLLKNNNNLSYLQWKFLAIKYVYNFSFIPIIKFIRRILIHLLG
jgi:glycosyltransferase involved in cell wall biosynthesis